MGIIISIIQRCKEDISTVLIRDPASRSTLEVLLCYSGLHAIWMYRIAHFLWGYHFFLIARLISQIARFLTGVEIHPACHIGRRFFIDHGRGCIIGETSELQNDIIMYSGCVLGGVSSEKTKRHPTVESEVILGTGSVILGNITIPRGSRVGAGAVVVTPTPKLWWRM